MNPRDNYHERARGIAPQIAGCRFWTTDLVLVEVANALRAQRLRQHAADYLRIVAQSSDTTIIRLTPELFDRALTLYEERIDKRWSLTDCLSFVIMQDHNISEALTGDRDFTQAGFSSLLNGGKNP